jgi:hypothetical protein
MIRTETFAGTDFLLRNDGVVRLCPPLAKWIIDALAAQARPG